MPDAMTADVEGLLALLGAAAASEYFGEPVSQLEHALQTAHLARQASADDETIGAALLHDIGHLVACSRADEADDLGTADHDRAGAAYLRAGGLSERLTALVEGHVAAKRYLTATNPAYRSQLSEASTRTLALQGGPMDEAECEAFRGDPLFAEKLRLRSWDEMAKEPGAAVPQLETYRELLLRLVRTPS